MRTFLPMFFNAVGAMLTISYFQQDTGEDSSADALVYRDKLSLERPERTPWSPICCGLLHPFE